LILDVIAALSFVPLFVHFPRSLLLRMHVQSTIQQIA
jgi:hypothetical protein